MQIQVPAVAKRVFLIAWPAVAEAYLQNLLGVIDMIFIAHISLAAVSAVGLTNIYNLTYIAIFLAVSTALSVFLARFVGAGKLAAGRGVVWHGLMITFVVGMILATASLMFPVPFLHLMGAQGQLLGTALPYFRVVVATTPLIGLYTGQSAAFRAIGKTNVPLRIGMEMNVMHVALDYVLIFGIGPLSGFGIRGAAWSMVIVRTYALLRLWQKSRRIESISLHKHDLRVQPRLLQQMVSFALPAAAERLSKRIGQLVYFGLIVRMGVDVYATHNIAGTLTPFAAVVGEGFATAATATIGEAIGRGNTHLVTAYRKWSYLQSAFAMTVITAVLCVFSPWLGHLYTDNLRVIHLLLVILAIDAISQPFMSSVVIDTAVIQAGGNTRLPMVVTTIGIWGIRVVGVYVFAWRMHFGLPAVWASIAVDNAARSIAFTWYRRKRAWIRTLS